MADGGDNRSWDELIPDTLGLIFSKLSLQEILIVIPTVCKSWRKVVLGPYCWQEIDIEDWSFLFEPEDVDRMLHLLIPRSSGSLRKLTTDGLKTRSIFSFIADHAGSLETLRIPRSNICDSIVEEIAGRLSTVTFLDLSYCWKISAHSLELIGKNCKFLVGLCRNLKRVNSTGEPFKDDEAYAIAATMPKIKHLEMSFHHISSDSVIEILSSCTELEFFNLSGCWEVKLHESFIREKFPKLKILAPRVRDYFEKSNWDEFRDLSVGSDDTDKEAGFCYDDPDSLPREFFTDGYDSGDYDNDDVINELEIRW